MSIALGIAIAVTIIKEIKERSKEIIAKISQGRLRAITLIGVLEKRPILLLIR